MTATMLFLIILAAALLSNSVVVGVQMWIVRAATHRETGKRPRMHICEPPSWTDDELEEQIIAQQKMAEGYDRLEQRRKEAVTRLVKRGVLVADPVAQIGGIYPGVRAVPPAAKTS